jgi:hypothetical protein
MTADRPGAPPRSAFTLESDAARAAHDIRRQLGDRPPCAVVFFCAWHHDGAALSATLREHWPGTTVVGCTTAGAFTESEEADDGVSVFAIGRDQASRCGAALAPYEPAGPGAAIRAATASLSDQLGLDLREAAPDRYVGLVLMDGLGGGEEEVNHALGVAAPTLVFAGGSAGDGLRFEQTRVFCNGQESGRGAVLLLLDMTAPFTILKTESVEPAGASLTATRLDEENRIIHEFDGRPADAAYAEAAGLALDDLDIEHFRHFPLGFMEGDRPWLRSPMQRQPDGSLRFLCELGEGDTYELMRQTDIIATTRRDLQRAEADLGTPIQSALVFNCVYRRLEMDADDLHDQHRGLYGQMHAAGFHTYGESYLGHVNQTAVMLLIG